MNASSNPSLHRTPAAQLSSLHRGVRPAPVSSKTLGALFRSRAVALITVLGGLTASACAHRIIDYTFQVTGTVVDEAGAPVRGAQVRLEIPVTVYQCLEPITQGRSYTDDRGQFFFDYISHARGPVYSLWFEKDGYTTEAIEEASLAESPFRIVLKKASK